MEEAKNFNVEYELGGVIFYQPVQAKDIEEAKVMVKQQQATANIRAVNIVNEEKSE